MKSPHLPAPPHLSFQQVGKALFPTSPPSPPPLGGEGGGGVGLASLLTVIDPPPTVIDGEPSDVRACGAGGGRKSTALGSRTGGGGKNSQARISNRGSARRAQFRLCREGRQINFKRIFRLYRNEGVQVRTNVTRRLPLRSSCGRWT